ncbi:MAG TPA: DUF2267 domain-containing protein [Polyangia bacterium]
MALFDRMNQRAMIWVQDMMTELRTVDADKAFHALRAGLQALRDRLSVEEAAQLAAQLPLIIRGVFFEGWDPTGKPTRVRHAEDFLALVRNNYEPRTDLAADDVVVALFRVLSRHVSEGELTDVMMSLPREIVAVALPRVEH